MRVALFAVVVGVGFAVGATEVVVDCGVGVAVAFGDDCLDAVVVAVGFALAVGVVVAVGAAVAVTASCGVPDSTPIVAPVRSSMVAATSEFG